MRTNIFKLIMIATVIVLYGTYSAKDYSPLTESEIDQLAEKSLKEFHIPGIAIAIIERGKITHAKGYGYRDIENKNKVSADTLFQIASNSKSMTAAALALLVDDGTLDWNDKVIDCLREF